MTRSPDQVIEEAVAIIDRALRDLVHRELVSSQEVADVLLDVRTLLSAAQRDRTPEPQGSGAGR